MGKNQKGFGAIEIVLIVVVATVLAATGWYALHTKRQTDQILSQSEKTSQTAAGSEKSGGAASSSSGGSAAPASNAAKDLIISQWGVKLPLPPAISDAYYSVAKDDAGFPNAYSLGTKSLTALDPQCAPDQIGAGLIVRQTAAQHDQNASYKDPLNYPVFQTKVGNYYYQLQHTQQGCSSDNSADQKQQSVFMSFQTAFSGIAVE